jgi:hypothetical protein
VLQVLLPLEIVALLISFSVIFLFLNLRAEFCNHFNAPFLFVEAFVEEVIRLPDDELLLLLLVTEQVT